MNLNRKVLLVAALGAFSTGAVLADGKWTHEKTDDRIGRIYYYERTNQDGTRAERITVFRRSRGEIEVYKENGLCLNAALVTATIDLDRLSPSRITGGRLLPEARHKEFAFLTTTPEMDQISVRAQLPNREFRYEAPINHRPWALFDFDLADLTVGLPHIDDRRSGFVFGMALFWADTSAGDPLTWMGELKAEYVRDEPHLAHSTERYDVSGPAFETADATGVTGTLWVDTADGFIVDAQFPVPNHPGYDDFRLRLLDVSDGGLPEWTALLTAHFANCDE